MFQHFYSYRRHPHRRKFLIAAILGTSVLAAPLLDHGAKFIDYCSAFFLPPEPPALQDAVASAAAPEPAPSGVGAPAAIASDSAVNPEFLNFQSTPGAGPGRSWTFPIRAVDAPGGLGGAGRTALGSFIAGTSGGTGGGVGAFGATAFASAGGVAEPGFPRPSNFANPGIRIAPAGAPVADDPAGTPSDPVSSVPASADGGKESGVPAIVAAIEPATVGEPPQWSTQPFDPAQKQLVAVAAVNKVPEPGSLALVGMGLAVLAGLLVRRIRARRG